MRFCYLITEFNNTRLSRNRSVLEASEIPYARLPSVLSSSMDTLVEASNSTFHNLDDYLHVPYMYILSSALLFFTTFKLRLKNFVGQDTNGFNSADFACQLGCSSVPTQAGRRQGLALQTSRRCNAIIQRTRTLRDNSRSQVICRLVLSICRG